MIELDRKNCPMRATNGNCLPVGGFCTAVPDINCAIAHQAYGQGFLDNSHRIITCSECKHGKFDKVNNKYQCEKIRLRTWFIIWHDGTFYCKDGEEKDGEQE